MAGITFTATAHAVGGTSALARALMAAARPRLRAGGENMVEEAIENVQRTVSSTYSHRNPGRSRSLSLHNVSGWMDGKVQDAPDGVVVVFRVRVGDNLFLAKFHSLNGGTRAHQIRPRRANGWLVFPYPNEGDPERFARSVGWRERGGKFGKHFYEDGIDQAIATFHT